MKTNINEKKAAKAAAKKQEDIKFYRLVVEFVLVIIALFLAISAGNNQLFVLPNIMPTFIAVSGVLFGMSAIYFSVMHAKRIDESDRIITSGGIFGNAAVLFALSAAFYLYMSAELVILSLIAFAVVYIAYNVEGAEFFGYSVFAAASYILIKLAGTQELYEHSLYAIGDIIIMISRVLVFVVPALMILLAILTFAKKGGVTLLGVKFSKKRIATAMLITALIALAGAVLTVIYPAAVSIALYALLALYFIVTVIGIFKMM